MKTGTNETQKPKKSKIVLRILGFILLGFVALIVLIIIFAPKETESENKPTTNTTASLSENDAEVFCQDAALLKKYIDTTRIKVIDVLNYNKYYTETGDKDSDGKDIMQLTWNGKRGDETLGFTCWVSGSKDNTVLQKLSVNGMVYYAKQ